MTHLLRVQLGRRDEAAATEDAEEIRLTSWFFLSDILDKYPQKCLEYLELSWKTSTEFHRFVGQFLLQHDKATEINRDSASENSASTAGFWIGRETHHNSAVAWWSSKLNRNQAGNTLPVP